MSFAARHRVAVLLVILLLASATLAGCATTVSGSGRMAVGDFPSPTASATSEGAAADDLVRTLKSGFLDANVALSGTFTDGDVTVRLDARYAYDDGFVGRAVLSFGAIRMEVRTRGNNSWIQAPATFWAHAEIPGAEAVASDQWVLALDGTGWPACYGSIAYAEGLVLPLETADVEVDHESTVGGAHATVLTDSDNWSYTVLDGGATPEIVHAEGDDDSYDISYPTDVLTVEEPPAASVVQVPNL